MREIGRITLLQIQRSSLTVGKRLEEMIVQMGDKVFVVDTEQFV